MKFNLGRFSIEETDRRSIKQLWYPWFAWRPIKLPSTEFAWLVVIWRQRTGNWDSTWRYQEHLSESEVRRDNTNRSYGSECNTLRSEYANLLKNFTGKTVAYSTVRKRIKELTHTFIQDDFDFINNYCDYEKGEVEYLIYPNKVTVVEYPPTADNVRDLKPPARQLKG